MKLVKPLPEFSVADLATAYVKLSEKGEFIPPYFLGFNRSTTGKTINLALVEDGCTLLVSERHLYEVLVVLRAMEYPPEEVVLTDAHPALWMMDSHVNGNLKIYKTSKLFELLEKFEKFRTTGRLVVLDEEFPRGAINSIKRGTLNRVLNDPAVDRIYMFRNEGLTELVEASFNKDGKLVGTDCRGWKYISPDMSRTWIVEKIKEEYDQEEQGQNSN